MKIAIIGGGAAGFFLGAQLASSLLEVHIFEKASTPLQKVKISGGGRCNVTHACFDPVMLTDFYPRGNKELKSVFGRFQPGDTMAWFQDRGVPLKIQDDMRVFPVSDNSGDIVNCLIQENQKNNVHIHLNQAVKKVNQKENYFLVQTQQGVNKFDKIVFCPGASKQAWQLIEELGHSIVSPMPSLFTFKCNDQRLQDLAGTTFPNAEIEINNTSLDNSGSLLITHWGFSGPAVLVLSAWGARVLSDLNYHFSIKINFIGYGTEEAFEILKKIKAEKTNQKIGKNACFDLTKRFWKTILEYSKVDSGSTWQEISDKKLLKIVENITAAIFKINGKSTFKDEFVTAGGVDLKEINFKNMESKIVPNVYFAGEVLNIDAVTGGFNFQACWSEAFIISEGLMKLIG